MRIKKFEIFLRFLKPFLHHGCLISESARRELLPRRSRCADRSGLYFVFFCGTPYRRCCFHSRNTDPFGVSPNNESTRSEWILAIPPPPIRFLFRGLLHSTTILPCRIVRQGAFFACFSVSTKNAPAFEQERFYMHQSVSTIFARY